MQNLYLNSLKYYLKSPRSSVGLKLGGLRRFFRSRRRKILAATLAVLILITSLQTLLFFREAKATWFNDDWSFRKTITISNSGSEQTDMQVKITFDTKTLITEGKLQADCDDIRVTNNDGNLLTHAVVGCNNTYSEIWLKLATVPTYDITLYVYYGNSSVSNVEDGDSVFEFYDNFDDGNYDGWTVNGGTWSAATGVLESGSGSHPIIYNPNYDSTDYIFESTMTITNTISGDQQAWNLGRMVNTSNFYAYGYRGADANTRWELWENLSTEHAQHDPQTMTQNVWVKQAILFNSTTIKGKSWAIDSASDPGWQLNVTDASHASGDIGFKGTWATATVQFDDAFVRKFVATDPTSSVGSEEIGPGPSAYWKFDEGYGTKYYDSTANDNDLNYGPVSGVEQQINIMDQDFTVGDNETYDPTDNSLGIIRWDTELYSDATIYFEAIIKDSALGGSCFDAARAYLYDTDGNQVSGATARPCTTSYGRDRSSAISLADNTDYTVRLWNNTGTAVMRAARLIIVQSSTDGLESTTTQVEIGANENLSSSTATQLTDKKIYRYDSTQFNPAPTAYFEASLQSVQPTIEQQINIIDQDFTLYDVPTNYPTDNSLGIIRWDANRYTGATIYFEVIIKDSSLGGSCADAARAYLYDTGGSSVSGSEARPCTTSFGRARSSAITLTDDTDYTVRLWNNKGTAVMRAARLIIVQSSATGIDDTTTQVEIGAAESQSSSTATQLTDKKIYQYDSSQFSPAPTVYFEASLRNVEPTIEQRINILDQDYSSTTASYLPTDNSLGLFHWDADKYSGTVTVYLDHVAKDSGLGGGCSDQARVALYTAGGTQVASSITFVCNTTYVHRRSSSFTLTDDTDYTVRLYNNNGTAVLHSAWLTVVQSQSGGIVDTLTQVEVGDNETGFTNETYSALTDEKIYLFDQDQFSPVPTASFSATLKIDDAGDTVHAQLFNCGSPCNPASGQQVAEITHTGDTNWTLITADNIQSDGDWDTTNDDEYIVRIRCNDDNTGGCTGNIANAGITLDQHAGGGITDVELIHQQVNSLFTDADSTYTDQDFKNSFNPDLEEVASQQGTLLGGTFTYFYEGTLMTDNGSNAAFAQLKNDEDGLTIANSEITTSNTSYTRVRSSDITSDLPSYPIAKGDDFTPGKDLDTQLKNSTTSTTSAASTSLVIQVSNLATASITAYADLFNLTDTSQVSSSEVNTTNTTWTRVRSGSITLTTLKDYVVRLKSGVNNAPIYMANAKLVLDQDAGGSGITDVELIHQYVNMVATDSDSTYSDTDYLNRYNPDFEDDGGQPGTLLGGVFTYFFESTLKTDNGSNDAFAQLRNDTDASVISNSEVSTTSTSYTRVRSPDITSDMPQNQTVGKNMDTQLKNNATNTTSASISWLIIQTSSLSTSSATAYADLYNLTDGAQVSGSEVSSTSNSWNRVRSSAITLTTDKNYVVRIRSSISGVTIYVANAKLILEQNVAGVRVEKVETVHQYINHLATDSDTGYTDQDYMNEFNPSNFITQGGVVYYFEATLNTSNVANAAYAQLENDTDTSAITGSEVNASLTSYTRVRSGDITSNMPSSTKTLETQLKNNSTDTTSASTSWLIIQVEGVLLADDQPTWQTEDQCIFGKCLFFDGVDDAAIALNRSSIDMDLQLASGFTFQTWVRVNSDGEANQGEIFDKGTDTYLRITNDGTDGFADLEASLSLQTATASATMTNGITLNKWHHVAMTYTDDGDDEITLYIDTIDKGSSSNGNGAPATDSNNFTLGGDASNNFHGFMDEFKIYKEERTQDEIKADFIKGTTSFAGASAAQGIRSYYDLSEGLVGYWKMDEAGVDTCTGGSNDSCDSSGNANDLAWTGSVTAGTGKFGNNTTYAGTDDYATISDASQTGLDVGTNDLTIALWAKTSQSGDQDFVNKNDAADGPGYLVGIRSTGKIDAFIGDGTTSGNVVSTSTVHDDIWHHIVAVYDRDSTVQIYIDGSPNGSGVSIASFSTSDINATSRVTFGADAINDNDFNGSLDDVRMYNRAFSPSEVEFLYNWAPGPVGYWPLDENTGTLTVYDRSGNENNGTMNNFETEDWVPGRFGSALNPDGVNEYVTRADDADFDFAAADNFTLESWIKHGTSFGTSGHFFEIDHEEGDKSEYDSEVGGEDLAATSGSAQAGTNFGLEITYDDTTNSLGQKNFTALSTQTEYRYRFYFDINSLTMATNDAFFIFAPGDGSDSKQSIIVRDDGTNYDIRACLETDSGSCNYTAFYDITDAPHLIEVHVTKAATNVSSDATLEFFIDGVLQETLSGIDHFDDFALTNRIRAGAIAGLDATTSGTFYIDEIAFRDDGDEIGPAQDAVIGKYEISGADGGYKLVMERDGDITFGIDDDNSAFPEDSVTSTAATYDDNEWHHVVGVKNGTTDIKLYIDGELITTDSSIAATGTLVNNDALYLGIEGNGATKAWAGQLDEVKIYNYARTQSQIIEDLNAGHPAPGSPIGSPIGHWKFDEGYGDTAYDAGTGANNGDLAGSGTTCPQAADSACPTWTNSGKFDKALDFDLAGATDDYIQTTSSELATANDFTMTTWINADSTAAYGMILWEGDVVGNGFGAGDMTEQEAHFSVGNYTGSHISDKISFFLGDTHEQNDAGVLHISVDFTDTTNWHHLAGVVRNLSTSPESEFYIDGVLVGTDTGTTARTSRSNWDTNLRIGRPGDAVRYFDGQIDEVKIYNFALTAAQVKGDMNKGSAVSFGDVANQDNEGFGGNAPVGWWNFNENTGTTANDISGNDNTGTLTNGPDWIPATKSPSNAHGLAGSAIYFNANQEHVLVSDDNTLNFGTSTDFTITAWIKMESTNKADRNIVFKNRFRLQYDSSPDALRAYITPGDATFCTINGTTDIEDGQWHHVVAVFNRNASCTTSDILLYVDGVQESTSVSASTANTNADVTSANDLEISRDDSAAFIGPMDDVRIYDYALSQAQVAYNFNRGKPLGYWKLDDCQGTTADDSGSGDNDGTITIGGTGDNTTPGTCTGSSGEAWFAGATGKRNASLDFDGTDDLVDLGSLFSGDQIAGSFSVWINFDSFASTDRPIFFKGFGDALYPRLFYDVSDDDLQLQWKLDAVTLKIEIANFSSNYSTGEWIHAVATFDATADEVKLYINGVLQGTETTTGTDFDGSTDNILLARDTNLLVWYDGSLDEFKIYNYALTADQVKRDYTGGAQFFGPSEGSP